VLARLVANALTQSLGQPVVVENRAGAAGTIGMSYVATAVPDGYTLGIGLSTTQVIAPHTYSRQPYDPRKDFVPISEIAASPFVLAVTPSLPVKNVDELVALARREPGKLSFGSTGEGGSTHLAGELLKKAAGIDIVHVPYKGSSQIISDLMAGHIAIGFLDTSAAVPLLKAGRIRALAVTSDRRLDGLPDIPAMSETGFPVEAVGWTALFAPPGTPDAIVARLNAEVVKAVQDPAMRKRLVELGQEPVGSTARQLADKIDRDDRKWGALIAELGIKAN
jgi:tripartite-type tricarboxylate transporter receptor subunit TctC